MKKGEIQDASLTRLFFRREDAQGKFVLQTALSSSCLLAIFFLRDYFFLLSLVLEFWCRSLSIRFDINIKWRYMGCQGKRPEVRFLCSSRATLPSCRTCFHTCQKTQGFLTSHQFEGEGILR